MRATLAVLGAVFLLSLMAHGQMAWRSELDSRVRFYQATDFGIVLAGTEKSLYALDGKTGERIWRQSTGKIEETAVTPVPNTDLILFTRDVGDKSRLEAVDVLTGSRIWQSDKIKGDVMQLALDPENDLLTVVMVKDPRGKAGDRFKRKPVVHVLRLSDGDELWKRELDGDVEMMPTRFGVEGDIDHTLDNYRPPLMLDGRLFVFYEGSTSYDARTGKEKEREKFKVNEDGLALTEADPVWDESHIYVSGRGQVRAIDRRTGKDAWKANDLGNCAEMVLVGDVLYVRTGGQFTRLEDGEVKEKGPYGVSAINVANGKTLWRYKGADKGLTNFAFLDERTIAIADRDDLMTIDAISGKRIAKRDHKIDKAQFVIVNESGQLVVGGRNEIAAFETRGATSPAEVWRARHTAPGRGVFRTVAGIALRAAAIYFRYAGPVMSGIGLARSGLNIMSAANSFRWSGLGTRIGSLDLTSMASNYARNYVTGRIYSYGSLARNASMASRLSGVQIVVPNARDIRGQIIGRAVDRVTPSRAEVQESILDRLDPTRQLDRLGEWLLRRKRLAELRSDHMYFYTDLRTFDKKGLVGVNVHTGQDQRFVLASDPDPNFTIDENAGILYSANGSRLEAYRLIGN